MPAVMLRSHAVGVYRTNSYAVVCPITHQSILIDPGAEPQILQGLLADTTPVAILVTHAHEDHIGALDTMRWKLDVPVMAHRNNAHNNRSVAPQRWLEDGEMVMFGKQRLRALHTPGHTPDMLCFAIEGDHRMLVGDTLFAGGPGKTWSPKDFQQTLHTLRTHILSWDDDTVCYPGHGEAFRLGDVRPAIEQFVAAPHGNFYGDATWDM